MSEQKFLIIITRGVEDSIKQVIFGFHYALTLKNMGKDVSIFLTGSAVKPAIKDEFDAMHGEKVDILKEAVSAYLEAEGELLVCITCIREVANMEKHKSAQKCLVDGAKVAGLNVIAEISLESKIVAI